MTYRKMKVVKKKQTKPSKKKVKRTSARLEKLSSYDDSNFRSRTEIDDHLDFFATNDFKIGDW